MNKILYATDFSENAEKAFTHALKMAKAHDTSLILLHVFDILTASSFPYIQDALEMKKQAIKESKEKLKQLFNTANSELSVDFMAIESTSVASGIISAIKEIDPDLVIIGTRGGSKIREVIVGSTTRTVVQESTCPILAIPENSIDRNFKKVIYATGYNEYDISAIEELIEIVEPFGSEITILHVSTAKEYAGDEKMVWFEELVKENVSYSKLKFQLLLSDNIYESLNSYLNRYEIDLLAMLEEGHLGMLQRLFHGDLVEKMEFHVTMPVIRFEERYLLKKQKNLTIK